MPVVRRPLQQALDELRFGPSRTLNLRASLPSAGEAVKRAESWLRMKQAEGVREVLLITGRGTNSYARIPVVREAVRRLLALLATRGVVADHREHSPGSFAVRLAPLSAAASYRADVGASRMEAEPDPPTLDGLSEGTRDLLRELALGTLQSLGLRNPSPVFVRDEMIRQCARLAASLPGSGTADDREQLLRASIARALERLDDEPQ